MKIFKATRKYEKWLRQKIGVFEDDLSLKTQKLAEDPSAFLRGTFYRWMQLWPAICKKIADAPVVLSVGDLHAANFGTWRDARDQLVWGINDFDEAGPLPYTLDLTRLAASVELASEMQELKIGLEQACEAILEGYEQSLESGGKPFILNDKNEWLRKAYGQGEKSADEYWRELEQSPDMEFEIPTEARIALEAALPAKGLEYRLKHRLVGVGSLGRPRYTALATFESERIARETKPLLASAALWEPLSKSLLFLLYGLSLCCWLLLGRDFLRHNLPTFRFFFPFTNLATVNATSLAWLRLTHAELCLPVPRW